MNMLELDKLGDLFLAAIKAKALYQENEEAFEASRERCFELLKMLGEDGADLDVGFVMGYAAGIDNAFAISRERGRE
ncbi:MAG: hypothetical protein LBO82_06545 [Synergistaceae bacterium]|jgi:hypothetical protein|nr:hypothetical protein [Synergistaceae bacterium]